MKTKLHQFTLAFSLLLFFFGSNQSMATHIIGTDFSYKCTGTAGVYEVIAKIYRDCSGVPICNCPISTPNCPIQLNISGTGAYEGVSYGTVTLTIVTSIPVSDPLNLCSSVASTCTNCGTRTPGYFSPGTEVYTFSGYANLINLPSALCNVRLSYNTCCKNNAITSITLPGYVNFFSEFYINRCIFPCNSSPALSENPVIVMCSGADQTINLRSEDPDGDSLSYHLAPSLAGANIIVPYATPYNQNVPFAYLGAPSQMALPGGIHFSPTTGDLMFRPIGNFVSNLVVEIKQWTKVNNLYTLAGSVRKDYQIYSKICASNSPVSFLKYDTLGAFQGAIGYEQDTAFIVFGQKFCRTFVASDSVQTDTTDFKWTSLNSMPGASVTRLFNVATRSANGPRQDSIRFCWTPYLPHMRKLPYVFTLTASDRVCPMPATTTRSLAIYVIKDPNQMRITKVVLVNPKCQTGVPTGSATIFAKNGVGPVQYRLNNGNFVSGNVFANIGAGTYKAYAKDSVGTIDSVSFTLQYTNALYLSVVSKTSLACKFDANATVTLGIQNGTAPFLYKELDKNFQSSNVIGGLKGGNVTLIVMDSNACFDTVLTSINEPLTLLVPRFSTDSAKCSYTKGKYNLWATGGSGTYNYSIDNGVTYDASTVNQYATPGVYHYKVKDANNCIKGDSFTVGKPPELVSNPTKTNVSCKGGNDGSIVIAASGGTPPYRYSLVFGNIKTNPSFLNLNAATYYPKVLDFNDCEISQEVVISQPSTLLKSSINSTDESCLGAKNAWALCTASDGTPPYSYTWNSSPIQSTDLAINLGSGKLLLNLKDSSNCIIKDSVQIGYRQVYQGENLCKVSTDTTNGAHLIIWNKSENQGIASYKIYGSTSASSGYTAIVNIPFLSEPIFVDTDVSRLNKTYFYQIKAVDSCNHESNVVGTHSNAFLRGFKVNGNNELNWKLPMGAIGIQNILVLRSNGSLPYAQIANLPSTATQFSDTLLPLSDSSKYVIEFVQTPQCNLQNGLYGKFYSNVIHSEGLLPNGLKENLASSNFAIYPNPSSGIFTISSKHASKSIVRLEVYNAQGAKVYSNFYNEKNNGNSLLGKIQIEINLSDLAAGIYYLDIYSQDNIKNSHKITLTN